MNRYNIALKKKVPKRYLKKAYKELDLWWRGAQLKFFSWWRRILFRRHTPFVPPFERNTFGGFSGIQGYTGYAGSTGIQGTTGLQGITGIGYTGGGVTGLGSSDNDNPTWQGV